MYANNVERFHTGIAMRLRGVELAREVARQQLASARNGRAGIPLEDAVVVARAAGIGASEIQRMAGCSRQTVYNLTSDTGRARIAAPSSQRGLEVLIALRATDGEVSIEDVAARLRVREQDLIPVVSHLRSESLVVSLTAGPLRAQSSIGPTNDGDEVLRDHLDDFVLTREDTFSVYMHAEPHELAALRHAADILMSRHEHDLIEVSVAPSSLSGPVLAFSVHTSSRRRAIEVACDVWKALRDLCSQHADLPPSAPRIANVIPPAIPPDAGSSVLDAFCDGIDEAMPDDHASVARARKRYAGDADDRELAGRCLTTAARALRHSLGHQGEPRPILHGDAAFDEWQIVSTLHLDSQLETIQEPLLRALDLATERLGPLAGGRAARLTARGSAAVPLVEPRLQELEEMANLAGVALGRAGNFAGIDPAEAVLRVALAR